jgi:alpha-L-fucosidase
MKTTSPLKLTLLLSLFLGAAEAAPEISIKTLKAGQASEHTVPEVDARWFNEAKFGMFIHWGLYSKLASGEWVMNKKRIPIAEYKKHAEDFNPVKFNAEEWVSVAKAAGMKYITITSKHHDGFAMFKSDVSNFNIVDATPFKRDIIKELSDACAKVGIKFGVYYSQAQDWSNPGGSMSKKGYWDPAQIKGKEAFENYLRRISIPQIIEVIKIANPSHIWFDTPIEMNADYGREIVNEIRRVKPNTLLNSRLLYHGYQVEGLNQEDLAKLKEVGVDYLSYRDRTIPSDPAVGWKWETCMTLSKAWGYNKNDHEWKSPADVVQMLTQVASKGGNFLLNFGPTAEGEIPSTGVEVVKQVGAWLLVNGEAIYGTEASDLKKTGATDAGPSVNADGSINEGHAKTINGHDKVDFDWLATSRPETKGAPAKIYLHLFKWPAGNFEVQKIVGKVNKAYLLSDKNKPLVYSQKDGLFSVELPQSAPDPIASVVCLELN